LTTKAADHGETRKPLDLMPVWVFESRADRWMQALVPRLGTRIDCGQQQNDISRL
jgi:hypothetical protein